MEKDTINTIKKVEEDCELKIKEARLALEKEKEDIVAKSKAREVEIIREYEEKKRNIKETLASELKKIDERVSANLSEKESNITKKAKANFDNFKKEVLKKI